jgi:hypothetical protein
MWRAPDIVDLRESLSQKEIDLYNNASASVDNANIVDPTVRMIRSTVSYVRGYIQSSPKGVALDTNGTTLPEGLIPPAMDYCAVQMLKRIPGEIAKSRTDAKDAAVKLFESIARGDYTPESYGSATTGSQCAVQLAASSRRRVTPAKLESTP